MAGGRGWKLAADTAHSPAHGAQAIVAAGFGSLACGTALFLDLPEACGGQWLADARAVAEVTIARQIGTERLERCVSVAFTWRGLQRMGLSAEALASFSAPFRQGMFQQDRSRRLGDRRGEDWLDTVIEGGPVWSGNIKAPPPPRPVDPYSAGMERDNTPPDVGISTHAMVLIYADSPQNVDESVQALEAAWAPHGVGISHRLMLKIERGEGEKFGREHFGFADGLSQPLPYDRDGAVLRDGQPVTTPDKINGTPLGDFLIGYRNRNDEIAPGPLVRADVDGAPLRSQTTLPAHPRALGFLDLGRNGSYLVVRQLRQDVRRFWDSLERTAQKLRESDSTASHITAQWLAERIVGRTMDGHVLRPDGTLPAGADGYPDNDFRYFDADQHGHGCPLGSHVRRANPRDALAPTGGDKDVLLDAANNHRILRRGRNYVASGATQDSAGDVGLLFMCLNTDILRQFEFTQQTWLMNSDFATLFEEVDPLVGPDGGMTIPQDPLRRRVQVETYVQLVGGEYFFLPSLQAIDYLSALSPPDGATE